mmetsp:Transcript_10093/g.20416  ORF Transcript_10093/g.20416 Transcript_10093/m.20416 type:complete len:188 (-) Transcript_10093:909-1472(-)|eukprot:CAMPEP_0184678140 /NCGR_PEP_ID=MMETSP0312-20130426/832_1 /TAXON_ID=31354 /ORGANISM="Compsopogon coeruleus, Strain SAG 36.94" /LENGTH=187 /DNA_ID=CAMNT_0027126627 /DNA_START=80 /DNA_END=643 /DNA_ORIENTATION=-
MGFVGVWMGYRGNGVWRGEEGYVRGVCVRRCVMNAAAVPGGTVVLPREDEVGTVEGMKGNARFGERAVNVLATEEEFDAMLADAGSRLVVVNFHATWCRKCIYLMNKFRKFAEQTDSILFGSVDVNRVARVPQREGIEVMPTLFLYQNGVKVDVVIGGDNGVQVIAELLEKSNLYRHRELDSNSQLQ